MATKRTGDDVPEWVRDPAEPTTGRQAYREFEPRPRQGDQPDERCTEPGCTKTLAEHREEGMRLVAGLHAKHLGGDPSDTMRRGSKA